MVGTALHIPCAEQHVLSDSSHQGTVFELPRSLCLCATCLSPLAVDAIGTVECDI